MISFEQEIKNCLSAQALEFADHSSSFKRLDFSVKLADKTFYFDAKEKRQPYNLTNWQLTKDNEPDTFILDDLAARKILAFAPYSGMVVRNNLTQAYHFFSVVDLMMLPKKRVNRPIHKMKKAWKGKWIIDLRNGQKCRSMQEVIQCLKEFVQNREQVFVKSLACFGNYYGEEVGQLGEVRTSGHWDIDVSSTR